MKKSGSDRHRRFGSGFHEPARTTWSSKALFGPCWATTRSVRWKRSKRRYDVWASFVWPPTRTVSPWSFATTAALRCFPVLQATRCTPSRPTKATSNLRHPCTNTAGFNGFAPTGLREISACVNGALAELQALDRPATEALPEGVRRIIVDISRGVVGPRRPRSSFVRGHGHFSER